MAILSFQKPDKVIMLEADNRHGKFEFRPLEPGYGITVGNALRRILLSSLEGFAITTVKIDGIDHEVKRQVWGAVFQRKEVFNTPAEFAEIVNMLCRNIKIG